MARPVRITKDIVDDIAFEIVRNEGFEGLTARNTAQTIGCSTQPIYKIYENMDSLKETTLEKIEYFMFEFVFNYEKTDSLFLNTGLGYIHFAKTEKIFRLMELELGEQELSEAEKEDLFTKTMISTYDLATLAFSNQLPFDEDEMATMLLQYKKITHTDQD